MTTVMIHWSGGAVTTHTVSEASVVKKDVIPSIRFVAGTAIARIMRRWRIVRMATGAIGDVHMVEPIGFPVGDEVTSVTLALKMCGWRQMTLAAYGGRVGKCAISVARFTSDVMAAIQLKETVVNILQEGDRGGIDVVWIALLAYLFLLIGGNGIHTGAAVPA